MPKMTSSLPMRKVLENIIIDEVTTHSASKVKKIDTSAPMEIGMAAGADGEQKAKVDGTEERVPVGAYKSTPSTAAKAKKERIVLEGVSGPRPEANKKEKARG